MFGADTDELRRIAGQSRQHCDALRVAAVRLESNVTTLEWRGADANMWRNDFGNLIRDIGHIIERIEADVVRTLQDQARSQDETSSATLYTGEEYTIHVFENDLKAVEDLKTNLHAHLGLNLDLQAVLEGLLEWGRQVLEELIRRLTELAAIDWTALLVSLLHDENFLKILTGIEKFTKVLGIFGAIATGVFAGAKRFAYDLQNYPNMPLEVRLARALFDGGFNSIGSYFGALGGQAVGAWIGGTLVGTSGAAAGTAASPGYGTAAGGGVGAVTGAGVGGVIGSMLGGLVLGTIADMTADWVLDDFLDPDQYK